MSNSLLYIEEYPLAGYAVLNTALDIVKYINRHYLQEGLMPYPKFLESADTLVGKYGQVNVTIFKNDFHVVASVCIGSQSFTATVAANNIDEAKIAADKIIRTAYLLPDTKSPAVSVDQQLRIAAISRWTVAERVYATLITHGANVPKPSVEDFYDPNYVWPYMDAQPGGTYVRPGGNGGNATPPRPI